MWQIRDVLERNRIVATFALQLFRFQCGNQLCPDDTPFRTAYEGLATGFSSSNLAPQVEIFDSSNDEAITPELIRIIQEAYNVSNL